jgi:hypothetical protein
MICRSLSYRIISHEKAQKSTGKQIELNSETAESYLFFCAFVPFRVANYSTRPLRMA